MQCLGEECEVPPKHEREQAALLSTYKDAYRQWHFQLSSGYGLLMYGFGSKKTLLENFASSVLTDGPAVVINGYLPAVKLKQVLYTVAKAVRESDYSLSRSFRRVAKGSDQPSSSQSVADLLTFLQNESEDKRVYVVVNSIDGPGLRDDAIQYTLPILAACPCVRFVASIDNVNAPLLWDKLSSNSKFNWWWHHTPTYSQYSAEGAQLPMLLSSTSSLESARSAGLVLKSLTPNAQSVFKILAEHQLAHHDDIGISLHQLHITCREQFLVSSELTLRAHLTEFRDHDLIRWRKGLDGQDCLHIPLSGDALSKLLRDLFPS